MYADKHNITNVKPMYDYSNKNGNGSEYDNSRSTYYTGSEDNMQLGYAK
jgi:hypothetical protein